MRAPSSLQHQLFRIARTAYGLAALIGAAALWGWAIGVAALRDLGADFAPMSAAEAIAFLLLGASFYATQQEGYAGRRSAYAAAAVAAALATFAFFLDILGGMSAATTLVIVSLAVTTPLSRNVRILGWSANALGASAIGAVALFALLGATLRVLRFDVAAPLLGFSVPGAIAAALAALAL